MIRTATRERILHAALTVFARKGYHRALVDDIVRASGTSKGAVYHHFPNKEALFLALVDDFAARLAHAVAEAISRSHGALAKVEAALRAGLETFAGNRELARILLLEAVTEGAIPPLDTRVATLAWLGAVNEVVIQWLSRGEPDLLAEAVPALTPMLLRSIGART